MKKIILVAGIILLYTAFHNITYSITHSQDYRKDLQIKWEKVLRDDKLIKEYEKSRLALSERQTNNNTTKNNGNIRKEIPKRDEQNKRFVNDDKQTFVEVAKEKENDKLIKEYEDKRIRTNIGNNLQTSIQPDILFFKSIIRKENKDNEFGNIKGNKPFIEVAKEKCKKVIARITCYSATGYRMANMKYPSEGWVATSDRTIPFNTIVVIDDKEYKVGDRTALWVHNKFGLTLDIFKNNCNMNFGAKYKEVCINI